MFSCDLLVMGYWLLIIDYWLLVIDYWLSVRSGWIELIMYIWQNPSCGESLKSGKAESPVFLVLKCVIYDTCLYDVCLSVSGSLAWWQSTSPLSRSSRRGWTLLRYKRTTTTSVWRALWTWETQPHNRRTHYTLLGWLFNRRYLSIQCY